MSDFKMSKETEESRKRLKEMLDKNPELKQAFKETLEEMMKPENIDKMAKEIEPGLKMIQALSILSKKKL